MKSPNDPFLLRVTAELINQHRCHTVLLYGSRARGDATSQSDYDLVGVRKSGKKYRIAEKRDGVYLDVFIYSEKDLEILDESFRRLEGAKIIFEKIGFGTALMKKVKALLKKKYHPLPPDEIQAVRIWLHKMFERIAQGGIEGNYRRAWLQEALLCDYFNLRKKRFAGSKQSFTWMKNHDVATYALFEKSLANPLDLKLLKKLVERVSQTKIRDY